MTSGGSHHEEITPVTQIRLRCAALCLPTWVCRVEGTIVETPTHGAAARAWLECRRLHDMIESCARRVIEFDEADVVELFEGCWALPVIVEEGADRRCVIIALAFEARAVQAKQFELITADAGMADDEAREALGELTTHRRADIHRHHAVMRWFNSDLAQVVEDELTIADLSRHLSDTYEQISAIYKLGRSMNCLDEPNEYVYFASAQLRTLLSFKWIVVQYVSSAFSGTKLPEQLIVTGESPIDHDEFARLAKGLMDGWPGDQWTRILEPSQHELAAVVHSQVIVEPILHDGQLIGAIFAGGKGGFDDEVTSVDTQLLDVAADFLGVFHQNAARYQVQRTLFMGTVRLSQAIDAKDPYTRGHSDRVAHLSRRIGRDLGLDEQTQQRLYVAGLVHDVGKIGVPEAVLTKSGKLTDEEFELIKRHPVIGYEILKDIPPMQDMLPGVLYHHERWDGGGYPEGLAGDDIPLFGRILAVADAFDAMSSDRAYRSRMSRDKVLSILRDNGGQWDAQIVEVFLQIDLGEYDTLSQRGADAAFKAA